MFNKRELRARFSESFGATQREIDLFPDMIAHRKARMRATVGEQLVDFLEKTDNVTNVVAYWIEDKEAISITEGIVISLVVDVTYESSN